MTDRARQGQARVIAAESGRSLDEVHRLLRLPGAPAPVDFVACVPVYDLDAALEWLGARPPVNSRPRIENLGVRAPSQAPAAPDPSSPSTRGHV